VPLRLNALLVFIRIGAEIIPTTAASTCELPGEAIYFSVVTEGPAQISGEKNDGALHIAGQLTLANYKQKVRQGLTRRPQPAAEPARAALYKSAQHVATRKQPRHSERPSRHPKP